MQAERGLTAPYQTALVVVHFQTRTGLVEPGASWNQKLNICIMKANIYDKIKKTIKTLHMFVSNL